MFGQGLDGITDFVRQDRELIETLEIVTNQYQACDVLQHYQVFIDALRLVADQIEVEIDETMDQFHTWFYD
jgi:hypothetical protein